MDVLNQEFIRLLANSGWKQSEAARHLELSPAVVTRYLNEDTRPSLTVLKLFKLMIGDMQPLPGENDQTVPASVLDRPLDAAERQLISQLRALDDTTRRRVVQGICTMISAFADADEPVTGEPTEAAAAVATVATSAPTKGTGKAVTQPTSTGAPRKSGTRAGR